MFSFPSLALIRPRDGDLGPHKSWCDSNGGRDDTGSTGKPGVHIL